MISRAAMRRREKLVGFFDFLTSPKERLLEKAQESVRLEKPTPVVESAVQELGERYPSVGAKLTEGRYWNREAEAELLRLTA